MPRKMGYVNGVFALFTMAGANAETFVHSDDKGNNFAAIFQNNRIGERSKIEIRRGPDFIIIERRGTDGNKATIIQRE
jgi:hypothetical protein